MCDKYWPLTGVKYRRAIPTQGKQQGVTLIELIVFMVIVGVAIAGVLKALQAANRDSVDPLIRKQALSIAESLLLEVQQQPFTFCDPDDPHAATATSVAQCSQSQDKSGAALTSPSPTSESRYSLTNPLDNVADYGGFVMPGGGCAGVCLPGDTTPLPDLAGYSASIAIMRAGGAGPFLGFPADAVLRITVTVIGPANTQVALTAYRTRFAPNV
jgi:MSHA pilin protein MshD